MYKQLTARLASTSSKHTEAIAHMIGQNLQGGEVLELTGDLGSGKTTFVRGLAKAQGSKDSVASPSFTLSHKYDGENLTIYHYDFYRLNQPGVIAHELAEALDDPGNVIVIEWANIVQDVLPDRRLTIEFKQTGDNDRLLKFSYRPDSDYLMEGLETIVNNNY
jgi:tRNA threonylcarbamoyladenosine biosynthesis protein TsaE